MLIINCLASIFILKLALGRSLEPLNSLRLVHVIFRHGDITPNFDTYPNDPYINSTYYPFGNSQLKNKGKRTEYNLGKLLKTRYGDFLGYIYQPNILEARTTNTDRTKMSLQLVLASLFPPTGRLEWNSDLNWMPIPFECLTTLDKELSGRYCPNFKPELQRFYETEGYKSSLTEYADVFNYISRESGGEYNDFGGAYTLYNNLFVEKNMGRRLPNWTESVFPEPLKTMAIKRFDVFAGTIDLSRMMTGFFLQKIVDDTKSKLTKEIKQKLYLYSAHKTNIGAILKSLEIFDPQIPPYGSYIAFEVHNNNHTTHMKILYENYTMSTPYEMSLPSCDTFCEFEKFVELITKYFPEANTCGD